jgi:NAD(P)-dependent dehydrogenase (short-subunit alcohol dehydrogenase family)
MDSCAFGAFHLAAAVVPTMRARQHGVIVNLITEHIRPERSIAGSPATGYDSAKFAVWRLTESWATELAPFGVRVNGLAFGATDTPMLRAVSVKIAEKAMRAEDMADAVFHIVDQGPKGRTGVIYDVGFTGTPRMESVRQIAAIAQDMS